MEANQLDKIYRAWLKNIVHMPQYRKLFDYLDGIDYVYTIPRDSNRLEDGISLRYRWADESDIPYPKVASLVDIRPCSVLEMMIALAIKAEDIMKQPRTSYEFVPYYLSVMLESLGLNRMYNTDFNDAYTDHIIRRFMANNYYNNGRGGLFPNVQRMPHYNSEEIWAQMSWYLTSTM